MSRGTVEATMVVVPVSTPAEPIPQIVRPIISIREDTDMADTSDPISNIAIKPMKTILRWNMRYMVPVNGVTAQLFL